MTDDSPQHRAIRSFVLRQGRMTQAQRQALADFWPRYGIDKTNETLDLDQCFGRVAQRVLEIGFGNGETLAGLAVAAPEKDFLGIEVHRPGVGALLARLAAAEVTNVKVISADAVAILKHCLPDAAFESVYILFPDPWPKSRHHKRRLIQPAFVTLLVGKLAPGGRLHLATDWQDYARQMQAVLDAEPALIRVADSDPERLRTETKFERRGRRLSHQVFDFIYRLR